MCYKTEEHKKIELWLKEELKDVPEFIADYFLLLKSSRTKKVNWGLIKDLLNFFIGNKIINKKSIADIEKADFQNLSFTHIIKYLDNLILKGNSLSTINTKKAVLGGFWSYLVTVEVANKNIVHNIPKNKYKEETTEKNVEIPTDEQLENFLHNIRNGKNIFDTQRNITMVKLFIGSGIRCEELIGLDMTDLYINIQHPYIMVMGKGKQQVQDKVYISDEASDYIQEYLEYRDLFIQERKDFGEYIDEIPLFLSHTGTRMKKDSVKNVFEKYSNKEIYPHMLRHLCGTRLYEKTKNIMIVQKQLRHKDVATAARYYVHVSEDDIINAVADL